ncbi:MAG: hypothetical protein ACLS3F_10935 [Oscillospiraceae bacterium]
MISAFLLLLCNSLFLSLHLSGGTGSFPKPLTAAQEREYLRRCAEETWRHGTCWWSTTCGWWRTL